MLRKIFIFFAIILLLAGCTYANEGENNESAAEETALPVKTEKVQTGTLNTATSITGTLMAEQQTAVFATGGGTVAAVEVSNGDQVEKGDVLVRLDATDAELNVNQARAGLEAAKANLQSAQNARQSAIEQAEQQLEQARSAYEFAKEQSSKQPQKPEMPPEMTEEMQQMVDTLLQQNQSDEASIQFELQQAEQNVKAAEQALEAAKRTDQIEAAEASVKQAEISLQMAQRQADELVIHAPIAGQISNLRINEGEIASPQAPLMSIVQIDPLVVMADVSAEQLADITEGQEVDVEIKATEEKLKGEISYISAVPGEESRKYPLEISFDETPEHLRPGMVAQVVLNESDASEQIIIPVDAVVQYEGKQYVFIVEGNRAKQQEVSTGLELNEQIVVEEGLSGDEEIVTSGQFQLSDGDLIEVQNESDESPQQNQAEES